LAWSGEAEDVGECGEVVGREGVEVGGCGGELGEEFEVVGVAGRHHLIMSAGIIDHFINGEP
jgi:hypothetical protein